MKRTPQAKRRQNGNGFTCAFEGTEPGMRKKLANKLFQESINGIVKDKNRLREFAEDIEDGCPHSCKSASNNGVTITAYAFKNGELGMHLDCSEHSCERNRPNAVFRFSACMDEPTLIAPLKLESASIKEHRKMKREENVKPKTDIS